MKRPLGQVLSIAGLAAHLGRGIGRLATDAIVGGRAGLPRTVGGLDIGVLSDIMGTSVTGMKVLGADAGTSSRARLALAGNDVPETVFVKLSAQTAATRLMGELGRLGHTEVRFYSQLAPELTGLNGLPKAYGTAFDPWTGRYVLVLEDLPAWSCEFPDTLHPGNIYFRDGRAGLLDWQAVRRGHPSRELAYTLITSLTPEDRTKAQRDLLDAYRSALAAAGGPELDSDDFWLRYRQGALYAYVATLITAGMGGMQVDDIALEGLRRAVAAIDELETIAALKNSV